MEYSKENNETLLLIGQFAQQHPGQAVQLLSRYKYKANANDPTMYLASLIIDGAIEYGEPFAEDLATAMEKASSQYNNADGSWAENVDWGAIVAGITGLAGDIMNTVVTSEQTQANMQIAQIYADAGVEISQNEYATTVAQAGLHAEQLAQQQARDREQKDKLLKIALIGGGVLTVVIISVALIVRRR